MNKLSAGTFGWRSLRIGVKFGVTSGLFLVIILLAVITGSAGLDITRNVENTMLAGTDAQRRVLVMSRNWESVRRLQESFFLQYPVIGAARSFTLYALPGSVKISEIIRDTAALTQMAQSSDADIFLHKYTAHLTSILTKVNQYAVTFEKATKLIHQAEEDNFSLEPKTGRLISGLLIQLDELDRSIEPELTSLLAGIQEEVNQALMRTNTVRRATNVMFALMILLSFVTTLSISILLHRSVTRNILQLTQAAGELERGNLEVSTPVNSSDELGQLAYTFNNMTAKLRTMISRLGVLREAGYEMSRKLDTNHILTTALDAAWKLCGAENMFIGLMKNNKMILELARGPYPPESVGSVLSMDAGILSRVSRLHRTESLPNIAAGGNETGFLPSIRSRIAIPLMSGEKLIGVFNIESPEAFFSPRIRLRRSNFSRRMRR